MSKMWLRKPYYTIICNGVRNISDPNDLVRFPGFGFWPLWYLEKFREKAFNLSTDTEERKVSNILTYSTIILPEIIVNYIVVNYIILRSSILSYDLICCDVCSLMLSDSDWFGLILMPTLCDLHWLDLVSVSP